MTRVKRGVTARHRHIKVLEMTEGQRGMRHIAYRHAHEAMMHSLKYATRDRLVRKRDMRKLWIMRINAGARLNGLSYSRFVEGLRAKGIEINRKMLADMAVNDTAGFTKLVELVRGAQPATA